MAKNKSYKSKPSIIVSKSYFLLDDGQPVKKVKKTASRKALSAYVKPEKKSKGKSKSKSVKPANIVSSKEVSVRQELPSAELDLLSTRSSPSKQAASTIKNPLSSFSRTDMDSWRDGIDRGSSETYLETAITETEAMSGDKLFKHRKNHIQQIDGVSYNTRYLDLSSIFLSVATGIAVLFGLVMMFLPGGNVAVPAMGGILKAAAPFQTAQITFLLDILFPIAFGAGFALLATAFQTRDSRPLVRMILGALLIVVLADFSENALVFKALTGDETYVLQWPLTVIKYAVLALAAVLLSVIIVTRGILGVSSMMFLRFVFPVLIACLLAGIWGRIGSDLIGATFPIGLLLLALYARNLSAQKS